MNPFFFYFFATLLILAGLAVILARNPIYSVLSLVAAIFSLASLFILLEAFFVGIILLLVYAGAVLVLFLFVVMFLNLNQAEVARVKQSRLRPLGFLAGAAFLAELLWVVKASVSAGSSSAESVRGTIETIGKILFTDYLLPFELTSFLLLAAVIGIVSLAKGTLKS
ncbi:MAG: NADH-quinone oxidoreductase subunit J [Candidatus Omnitrophica bacterium]|nr:NADH-quinone oxidoreductase subunit J [Candidatus Omnitrophota bacterium]